MITRSVSSPSNSILTLFLPSLDLAELGFVIKTSVLPKSAKQSCILSTPHQLYSQWREVPDRNTETVCLCSDLWLNMQCVFRSLLAQIQMLTLHFQGILPLTSCSLVTALSPTLESSNPSPETLQIGGYSWDIDSYKAILLLYYSHFTVGETK